VTSIVWDGPVLVVGGAGAIGAATAREAAATGARVWICDTENAGEIAQELQGDGHHGVVTDVRDSTAVEALVDSCWELGGPAGLVYAPGVMDSGAVADTTDEAFTQLMAVNLQGAFKVGRAVHRCLRTRPRALSIVFVSSVAGLRGEAGGALYCASKFGLLGFVQSFAAELADFGCRANAVCPGNVDTPMLGRLADQIAASGRRGRTEILQQLAATSAFRRLLTPDEVGRVCVWLLSPNASGISGQTIVVDGPPPVR
jgi:NAD(P)-dependent dehydrogenase (short-subunit alcohol dehydrogenase family)